MSHQVMCNYMSIGNLPGTMENAQFSAEMLPLGLIIAPNDIFVNFLNSFLFLGFFSLLF